ncbi:hypothetical protein [Candidatus Spongiihabitans sp.]
MPGPYYYYWPGNPVIKPFGVAELLLSRLRRGNAVLVSRVA